MPKAPPAPKTPTKKATIDDLTARILSRLRAIRASLSLPNSAPRPSLEPNEVFAGMRIYHGVSHNVDGPLHTRFDQLSRFFSVVCDRKSSPGSIRIAWDDVSIPRAVLEADAELVRLLELRSAVQSNRSVCSSPSGCSPPVSSSCGASTSRSSASCSSTMYPATSRLSSRSSAARMSAARSSAARLSAERLSNSGSSPLPPEPLESVSAATLPTSSRVSISQRIAQLMSVPAVPATGSSSANPVQSDDDEVEFVRFVPANRGARPEHPTPGRVKDNVHKSSGGVLPATGTVPTPPNTIMLTIVAWAANSYKHTMVKLAIESGQFITLNMVSDALRTLQLSNISELDRFIPAKGWNRILRDTLFRARDGDIISLKPSALQVVQNFEVHAAHFY
ncbi:hypothetical protein FB446DRAFT_794759 [Lentinula raphanica]|nr:hypothetical protein FB446DRAFT_794759 [Lentinula raphanica]